MTSTSTTTSHRLRYLEQRWITFQLDVAALRPALGPLLNAAGRGRRGHTFFVGQEPQKVLADCSMGPTAGQPNGLPDVWGSTSQGSYTARAISVAAASTILYTLDGAIQPLARDLGILGGANMQAGDDVPFSMASNPVKASTLIWAGANNVRHVDEWAATSASFRNPTNSSEQKRKIRQRASMAPIAALLGIQMPVTENVAYELFQFLSMISEEQGSYDRVELHVVRIGQDLVMRAGLNPALIGVTVNKIMPADAIGDVAHDSIVISDGMGRTASSVADVGHVFNVRPLGRERSDSDEREGDSDQHLGHGDASHAGHGDGIRAGNSSAGETDDG